MHPSVNKNFKKINNRILFLQNNGNLLINLKIIKNLIRCEFTTTTPATTTKKIKGH